jgi:hypothetical protein
MRVDLEIDYTERSGFLTGKSHALAEWSHRKGKKETGKLYARMRTRRWQKNNPERVRANNKKSDKKRYAKRRETRQHLIRGHVLTCAICKTTWCRIPCRYMGPEPKYCLNGCRKRAPHARVMADPKKRSAAVTRATAWRKANLEKRRAYQRKWARAKRARKRG